MTASNQKVEGWIDDIIGALFDPIIVMPGGWGDDLPEWLRTRVTLERLAENIVATREGREITATDAEAVCYLFTASLTAPMSDDWSQIYLYVAGKAYSRWHKSEMPDDIRVDSLNGEQMADLNRLKEWLYNQRTKARQGRKQSEQRDGNRRRMR